MSIQHVSLTPLDATNSTTLSQTPSAASSAKPPDYHSNAVAKPWGYEYLVYEDAVVSIWFVHMRAGLGTSLHSHPSTATTLICCQGVALVQTLGQDYKLQPNDGLTIEPGAFHALCALGDIDVMEALYPPDRDDLVRMLDFHGKPAQAISAGDYHSNTSLTNRSEVPNLLDFLFERDNKLLKKGNFLAGVGNLSFLKQHLPANSLAMSLSQCSLLSVSASRLDSREAANDRPASRYFGIVNWTVASLNADTTSRSVTLDRLYLENGRNWRYFLEWRHRMMARLFVAVGALFLALRYFLEANLQRLLFVPPAVAAGLFLVVAFMDDRNAEVAYIARKVGAALERTRRTEGTFYARYPEKSNFSYTAILRTGYRSGAIICACTAVYLFIRFRSWTIFF